MSGYPTRFWVAVGAIVATFIGLLGPWVKTIFVDIAGLDTDDGKLLAVIAAVAAVFLFVHAKHTVRVKRPLWPLLLVLMAGVGISATALYDRSDIEGLGSGSEFEGLATVGWGIWVDIAAGIVLVLAALALVVRRNAPYGRRAAAAAATASLAPPATAPVQPTEHAEGSEGSTN